MSMIKMRGSICFLPLNFSHYLSRPVPVPELFCKYPTRPVPKSKTPTRRTLPKIHGILESFARPPLCLFEFDLIELHSTIFCQHFEYMLSCGVSVCPVGHRDEEETIF